MRTISSEVIVQRLETDYGALSMSTVDTFTVTRGEKDTIGTADISIRRVSNEVMAQFHVGQRLRVTVEVLDGDTTEN